MKNPATLLLLCLISLAACKKQNEPGPLEGTWRLVTVYDKVDNGTVEVPRPTDVTGDVLLNFGGNNSFSATTFSMSHKGTYSLANNNELDFNTTEFSGRNADEWGLAFSVILSSCNLQSVFPCVPNKIIKAGNRLTINSALRYNLAFERVQ